MSVDSSAFSIMAIMLGMFCDGMPSLAKSAAGLPTPSSWVVACCPGQVFPSLVTIRMPAGAKTYPGDASAFQE